MKSFIPWVGGKSKLLWLIRKLSPSRYSRFIDVFGGSGTVTLSRPIQPGCIEVYNDFNSDLTNLFCCVKNRTMALLLELGFLPLNTRDDFNVLYKFFSKEEFTDDYLKEELELTERYLELPDAETIQRMMLERAPRGDVRRAADFFKLIRYSFSGGAKSFAGKSCDIRRFFYLIWECSRRLANVVIENKDCVKLIRQYDRPESFFYCDPPYYNADQYYEAVSSDGFDHAGLADALLGIKGKFLLSYNDCPEIRALYDRPGIVVEGISRLSNIAQRYENGKQYPELLISNYDTTELARSCVQLTLFDRLDSQEILNERILYHEI